LVNQVVGENPAVTSIADRVNHCPAGGDVVRLVRITPFDLPGSYW
jgi:hypothetical protein